MQRDIPHRRPWLRVLLENVRWGALEGLDFAFFSSTWMTIAFLLGGATLAVMRFGKRAPLVFALYAIAPILAGAVVGLLRPLTRYLLGKIVVAFVTSFVVVPIATLLIFPRAEDFWTLCLIVAIVVSVPYALAAQWAEEAVRNLRRRGPSRKS